MSTVVQVMNLEILRYSAFAATDDGGNPAGVVLDARSLGATDMLRIAGEIGYSETVFVSGGDVAATSSVPGEPRTVEVRFFSPAAEVPFCGHATVALAVALAERDGVGPLRVRTRAGDVQLVTRRGDGAVRASFTSVPPADRAIPAARLTRLLSLLGLETDDLAAGYPPREAFAGNWHPVLVLAERELFHQFSFAPAPLAALMRESGWNGTVTVLVRRDEATYEARNLFPVGRITEDPATGSAAAATGAYLRSLGLVPADGRLTIHQGARVGRPSLLLVDIPADGGITVTGGAHLLR